MATSRTTLRRAIGDRLGDLLVLTATSDADNTSSLSDVVRLGDRSDRAPSIVNKIGYFSGGTEANLGHECRMTDFTAAARTVVFAPAAPANPQTGDELELWSMAERIGSIGAIHRLINDAIRAVERIAEPETWSVPQTYDWRAQALSIPINWAEFGGAEWTDATGYRRDIDQSKLRVRPGQRAVEITGRAAHRAHRRSVTLWGYPISPQMTSEAAFTNVDAEWIVESVISAVALAGSWKATDAGAAERRANFWANQSLLFRRTVAAPRRGMGVMLP